MDVSAYKAKNIADAASSASNGTKTSKSSAEQLMGNFSAAVAERMNMTGQHVAERGQTGLIGVLSAKPDVQAEAPAEPKTVEATARDDHQHRERAEAPTTNNDDHITPVDAKDNAPQQNARQDDGRSDVADNSHDNDAPAQDNAQGDDQQAQDGSNTDQDAQTADNGEGAEAKDTSETTNADQAGAAGTQEVLAAVVDVVQKSTTATGEASAKEATVSTVAKVGDGAANQQAGANTSDAGDDLANLNLGDKGAKKGADNAGQQQAQANSGAKTDGNHTLNPDGTLKQQQAADIASKVGSNQKMDVTVNVTKQSEQLVSQPTASLGAQAAIADEGEGLSQTTTQAVAKGPAQGAQATAAHNLGNQAGQQGQDGQQQAQQNMQAALSDAAKNGAATDGKTQAAQNAANSAANGVAKVGGAEGMSNTQPATQTTTTQQQQPAAQAQKSATNPQAQHRAQVNEQVNVQISKAIANGMDKINIQLKPAHLGRVDVQMELSGDGRVTAVVTAENKDTLDLLKQDSRELERAMREAGLQMNSDDISYNLREQGGQGQGDSQTANAGSGPLTNEPTLDELLEANTARPNIISDDRVDITA